MTNPQTKQEAEAAVADLETRAQNRRAWGGEPDMRTLYLEAEAKRIRALVPLLPEATS